MGEYLNGKYILIAVGFSCQSPKITKSTQESNSKHFYKSEWKQPFFVVFVCLFCLFVVLFCFVLFFAYSQFYNIILIFKRRT